MPISTIKDIPDGMIEQLGERAKVNHRSLQDELMAILEEAVRHRRLKISEVVHMVKELGLKTGDDSTDWVRHDRDAR